MNKVEQIFGDLKAELVNLVGDLSGVHNAVDNAKVALAPHLTPPEESKDVGKNDENKGDDANAP